MGVLMAMGRPKAVLVLSPQQREQLEGLANSRSLPAGLVSRARIILLSASGKTNQQIARQLGLTNATVGKWRRRFLEQDVSGLHDELRPGRPRPISDERVAQLVRKTLDTKPKDGTHWSIRQIARQTRLSKSTVHRIWQAFGLEPHRQRHFKLSNDPFFVEKVRDIVGLYLNPPENAVVLCVDEKSQIQALERTQPMLPIGVGYVEGRKASG
jgi:putative transposase